MLINLQIELLLGLSHQVIVYAVVLFTDLDVSLLLLFGGERGSHSINCILVAIHLPERLVGRIGAISIWVVDAVW